MPWSFEAATVRPDRADDLLALIQLLFQRRSLPHLTGWARTWQVKEMVRDLQEMSVAYERASEASGETPAPFPFALAHLRIREGKLEAIASPVDIDDPELIVRILSEYLEPGAIVHMGAGATAQRWRVTGIDAAERLPAAADAPSDAATG